MDDLRLKERYVPDITYWPGITQQAYNDIVKNFKKPFWIFEDEAIEYCEIDCIALYEILIKFNELVYNEFSVNIHSSLTLPSLTYKRFKTHFLKDNTLYQISGDVENDIRQAFSGGAVDVFIPHNLIVDKIATNKAINGLSYDDYGRHKYVSPYDQKSATKYRNEKLYYYDVNSLYHISCLLMICL